MNGSHTIEVTLVNSLGEHLTVVTCPEAKASFLVRSYMYNMGSCPCGKAL